MLASVDEALGGRSANRGFAATLLLACPFAIWSWSAAAEREAASSLMLHYDLQVAWMNAGEIVMRLSRDGERYALSGSVATSRLMDRFFRWRGRFISTGRMAAGFPRTDAYMLWGDDGERHETLLSFAGKTTIMKSDEPSEQFEQPPGSDFMSVTFLAPHCLQETTLHDGERVYRLFAERPATEARIRHRSPYYEGLSERCDYRFRYTDGRTRRLSLWVARWQGERLPVRIRVRFPLLPDGVLLLRTASRTEANQEYRRPGGLGR